MQGSKGTPFLSQTRPNLVSREYFLMSHPRAEDVSISGWRPYKGKYLAAIVQRNTRFDRTLLRMNTLASLVYKLALVRTIPTIRSPSLSRIASNKYLSG